MDRDACVQLFCHICGPQWRARNLDDKVLSCVIQVYLTICTVRKHPNVMLKIEAGKIWRGRFLEVNQHRQLIDKTSMCNTITHCFNEYMVCVNKYLVYGLKDHYVILLKNLSFINYKMVGLKVLKHFFEQR